jgi:methylglutaconyl-CoA hydratase
MSKSDFEYVLIKENNGVVEIKLNRSEVHNAFNAKFIDELTCAFEESNSSQTRLVVLTGEGKSFCAGADLNWMKSMKDYSMEENIEDSKKLAKLFRTINQFPKPVLCKMNGHALGGGVGLVSACDYVISSNRAKLGFTETRLGLVPAVISPYVIAKIGESHARAWFISGEMFKADKAFQLGLVHEVVELKDLESRSTEKIQSFLKAGPEASVCAKKLMKDVLGLMKSGNDISKIEEYTCRTIAKQRVSEEGQEGMAALLDKRVANWIKE